MRLTAGRGLVNFFTSYVDAESGGRRQADETAAYRPCSAFYIARMPVHVSSEIGRLRAVLVHTPGSELLAVTPDTREDYLYDDIIDVETAKREHRRFVAILERFAQVHHVRDLLVEILHDRQVRGLRTRQTPAVA